MCRWLGYSGGAIAPAELVFKTRHSLIDQSLHAHASTLTTNGDGFGIGWHDHVDTPGLYKHIQPAWNDTNLRDVCEHVLSPLFLAHVRASTGTDIQRSNCHPFRHEQMLFVHNGLIERFGEVHRSLAMQVDETLYPHIRGTTDTELMFHLALSLGLAGDVPGAVARMVGRVEAACRARDIAEGVKMTLGITDGERLYAFRYATRGDSPSLFFSRDLQALRHIAPESGRAFLDRFPADARVVVSEPLVDLPEAWETVPHASWLVVENGEVSVHPFAPED